MEDACRTAFEEEARERGLLLARELSQPANYYYRDTQNAWFWWKTAWASCVNNPAISREEKDA